MFCNLLRGGEITGGTTQVSLIKSQTPQVSLLGPRAGGERCLRPHKPLPTSSEISSALPLVPPAVPIQPPALDLLCLPSVVPQGRLHLHPGLNHRLRPTDARSSSPRAPQPPGCFTPCLSPAHLRASSATEQTHSLSLMPLGVATGCPEGLRASFGFRPGNHLFCEALPHWQGRSRSQKTSPVLLVTFLRTLPHKPPAAAREILGGWLPQTEPIRGNSPEVWDGPVSH